MSFITTEINDILSLHLQLSLRGCYCSDNQAYRDQEPSQIGGPWGNKLGTKGKGTILYTSFPRAGQNSECSSIFHHSYSYFDIPTQAHHM